MRPRRSPIATAWARSLAPRLQEQPPRVRLDRVLGEEQLGADLRVGPPVAHADEDLDLPLRQRGTGGDARRDGALRLLRGHGSRRWPRAREGAARRAGAACASLSCATSGGWARRRGGGPGAVRRRQHGAGKDVRRDGGQLGPADVQVRKTTGTEREGAVEGRPVVGRGRVAPARRGGARHAAVGSPRSSRARRGARPAARPSAASAARGSAARRRTAAARTGPSAGTPIDVTTSRSRTTAEP